MASNPHLGSVVSEEDVCKLVARGEEHRQFDYKAPMSWDESSRDAIELIKDVMALANSDGGFLVIGANEKDNGGFDLVGVDDDQAATWETTRLGNKVRVYAEPPVSLRVRVVECQASRYIVITVDGFQRVPHICKKEYHTKE